jgi:hypothetical protein
VGTGVPGVRAGDGDGDGDGAGEPDDGDGAVVGTALGRGAALVGAGRFTVGLGFLAGRLVVLDGACGVVSALVGFGRTRKYITSAIRKTSVRTAVDRRIRQRGGRFANITGYPWGRRCPGRSAR